MLASTYAANWYGIKIDGASKQSTAKTETVVVVSGKIYANIKLQ